MDLVSSVEPRVQLAALEVEQGGIRFFDSAPGRVRIEIDVHNRDVVQSEPARMVLSSAPLGAFVPWLPLGSLTVPPIAPGGQAKLEFDANRLPVMPLGEAGRVPPGRLFTALAADDAQDRAEPTFSLMFRPFGRYETTRAFRTRTARLAPNLFDLLGQQTCHWAGNINVFVGRQSVERHRAQALRVYPGRINRAVFIVGKEPDAYRFELEGGPLADDASLMDAAALAFLSHRGGREYVIPTGRWRETRGLLLVVLELRPPSWCDQGELVVRVQQYSTGREARVEFSLDARAAGPGCFTV